MSILDRNSHAHRALGASDDQPNCESRPEGYGSAAVEILFGPLDKLVVIAPQPGAGAEFAISHLHRYRGDWHDVTRISCRDGSVHRHVYNRAGEVVLDQQVIRAINGRHGITTIEELYDECVQRTVKECRDNLQTWSRP